MNKSQMVEALTSLSEVASIWNDPNDEDRGAGNHPLCLLIYEDGSGRLCAAHEGIGATHGSWRLNTQQEFDSPQDLIEYLADYLHFEDNDACLHCGHSKEQHVEDQDECSFCSCIQYLVEEKFNAKNTV